MPLMPKLRIPRLAEVVLVLSLALNLFVAGGFAYSQYSAAHPVQAAPDRPDRRLEAFALRLGLEPEKSRPFKEWRRSLHQAQMQLFQENQPLVAQAWSEMTAPAPDAGQIQQMLDQMAAHRRAFQAEATAATLRFMGTLDEAQKKSFMSMVIDRTNQSAAPVRNSLGN